MGDQPDQDTWSGRWHREGKGSVTLLLQPQLDSQRGRVQGELGPWAEYKPLTRRQKPAAMTPREIGGGTSRLCGEGSPQADEGLCRCEGGGPQGSRLLCSSCSPGVIRGGEARWS